MNSSCGKIIVLFSEVYLKGIFSVRLQVLGDKSDLPEGSSDDIKADASNRKMAKLYKVGEQ